MPVSNKSRQSSSSETNPTKKQKIDDKEQLSAAKRAFLSAKKNLRAARMTLTAVKKQQKQATEEQQRKDAEDKAMYTYFAANETSLQKRLKLMNSLEKANFLQLNVMNNDGNIMQTQPLHEDSYVPSSQSSPRISPRNLPRNLPRNSLRSSLRNSASPSKSQDNHCIGCNKNLGSNNPRQYCNKTSCNSSPK
jgi:hypothetical protein